MSKYDHWIGKFAVVSDVKDATVFYVEDVDGFIAEITEAACIKCKPQFVDATLLREPTDFHVAEFL